VTYTWLIVRNQAAPCVDYSQTPEASNLFLNPDGTVIGCEMSGQEDVTPTDWAKQFHSPERYGHTLPTFDTRLGFHCDDCSVGGDGYINWSDQSQNGIPLGFDVNFYGQTFNSVFMNSNGSLTFGVPSTCYNEPLATMILCNEPGSDAPKIIAAAIAPLAVDLYNYDTSQSDLYYWGKSTIGGKPAFVGTWIKTTGYLGASDKFATFQVAIVSDATADPATSGDATVIMNYGSIQMTYVTYEIGDISSCTDPGCAKLGAGLGLYAPDDQGNWVMSLTPLTGETGTIYDTQYFANVRDTAAHPLISDALNSNVLGRYVYTFTNTIHPFTASATSKPTDVTATRVTGSSSELDVSWSAPTDLGGANVINYTVDYRPTGTAGQWSNQTTDGTSLRISGLTSLTNYDVFVTANNGVGDSPASDTVSAQTNPSTNADLQSLSGTGTSSVTLTPTFDSAILAYTSQVPYSVSSVCLSDSPSNVNATVVVKNGTSVIADCNANLLVGVNTLTFVITAQDGLTTKTYTWVITREADVTASPTPTPKSNPKVGCSVSGISATFKFGKSGPISNATKLALKKIAAHSKSAHYEITGCAGMKPGMSAKFVQALAMSRAKHIADYLVSLGVNRRLISIKAAVVPFGITPKAKILQQFVVT
jgi:Fibronectin type III domain/Cadherin-like beta sandwich domain